MKLSLLPFVDLCPTSSIDSGKKLACTTTSDLLRGPRFNGICLATRAVVMCAQSSSISRKPAQQPNNVYWRTGVIYAHFSSDSGCFSDRRTRFVLSYTLPQVFSYVFEHVPRLIGSMVPELPEHPNFFSLSASPLPSIVPL